MEGPKLAPPDWGDPHEELRALKALAKAIAERYPDAKISLDCFEEGYMNVDVANARGVRVAEVHVVPGRELRFGFFSETAGQPEEEYFTNPDQCLPLLSGLLTQL